MIRLKTILMESGSDELSDFEKLLKQHDWTYQRSDDRNAYKRGAAERKEIEDMFKKLSAGPLKNKAKSLYTKYYPKY